MEPIAIIGMSAKFAGEASDMGKLWRVMEEVKSGWTPFPASRFQTKHERLSDVYIKGAHFLKEDVALFDAAFFNDADQNASSLDPRCRLQLESVYEALENAGLPLSQLSGSNTSVFTGVSTISNQISRYFDFKLQSAMTQTSSSSGMIAMQQALQSLRTGNADMSIVSGVNLNLDLGMFKTLKSTSTFSATENCPASERCAGGYGRGEGVVTLVVKRLSDALASGDPVRAIVRELTIESDTTPSLDVQKALIQNCYRKAGLNTQDTQYFELYSADAYAGDEVEARAIDETFASRHDPLLIGSVKSNIGHIGAASGLASIIQVVLALERGVIPPSINLEKADREFCYERRNVRLIRELESWPTAAVRRTSINDFSHDGSNVHLILESADPSKSPSDRDNSHTLPFKVLVISANDEQACQDTIENLATFVSSQTRASVASLFDSLAYTLCERRTRFSWTAAHSVSTTSDLPSIASILRSSKLKPHHSGRKSRVGMVFTGQGAQWYAMGRELIDAYPAYRSAIAEAESDLRELGAEWSLLEELGRDAETSRLDDVALSTPVTVAVQIALVALLRTWRVEPAAVTSHSSGEIAAAYAAGVISCRTAMSIAYLRAECAAGPNLRGPIKGAMIAVGLGLEGTKRYLERLSPNGKAVVACINSPSSTTVAGDLLPVIELEKLCHADGVFARRLKVDVAWHSHHMARIENAYLEALQKLHTISECPESKITFFSPTTGSRVNDHRTITRPEHWVEGVTQPVQFVSAFTDMILGESETSAGNIDVLIEVGPHAALAGPIQQILALPEFDGLQIPYYGCLARRADARKSMQSLASHLVEEGYPVDLMAVNFPHGHGHHVGVLTNLPSYPWNHRVRYSVEPRADCASRDRSSQSDDLLGSLVERSNPETPSWRRRISISDSPWIRDYMIQDKCVYPAAGYLSRAIAAMKQFTRIQAHTWGDDLIGYRLRDVKFHLDLVIPDGPDGVEIQTSLRSVSNKDIGTREWKHFEIWAVTTENHWSLHAQGLIRIETASNSRSDLLAARPPLGEHGRYVMPSDLLANLKASGITNGPTFQNFKGIVQAQNPMAAPRSEVTFRVPHTPRGPGARLAALEAIITAPSSTLSGAGASETSVRTPHGLEELRVSVAIDYAMGQSFIADSILAREDANTVAADVMVRDCDSNALVVEMKGIVYQPLDNALLPRQANRWEKEPLSRVGWQSDISFQSSVTSGLRISSGRFAIVTSGKASPSSGWLSSLQSSIATITESDGALPSIEHLGSTTDVFTDKICIFVGEMDESLLHDMTESLLEGIHAMVTRCKGLIWLTHGGAVDCEHPELGLATGLIRTLRCEHVDRKFVTVDLDPNSESWTETGISAILQVLQAILDDGNDGQFAAGYEFAERNGTILTSQLNQEPLPTQSTGEDSKVTMSEPLFQSDRPLCLQPGRLTFGDDVLAQLHRERLAPGAIEVKPRAYGAEMDETAGRVASHECAGIITRVGSEAAAKGYSVGDRVLGLQQQSSFPSCAIMQWNSTAHVPESLTFKQAASLPIAFLTAYFSLVETARLRRFQSVLIHEATGAVGQAAIMIAQHLGAQIFTTVACQEDRELIMTTYGIPKHRVIDQVSFGTAVREATESRGVDVVLNSLVGPLLQESFDLVAPLGHFVDISKRDAEDNNNLEMRPFSRGVTFAAIDLPSLLQYRASDMHRCLREVMHLVEAKVAKPVHPITTLTLSEIADSPSLSRQGNRRGKIVYSANSETKIPMDPGDETMTLDSDASYLIVDGNSTLGQSIAHWLVSRGARNLILHSCSSDDWSRDNVEKFVADVRRAGCTRVRTISCDVADEESLALALDACTDEGLPHVRGVVHAGASMIQDDNDDDDSTAEKTTAFEGWTRATSSKVVGTWNLHSHFPFASDLDFFILLSTSSFPSPHSSAASSSISSFSRTAAHAAASAYQDAFANWRVKTAGLPAVALNLPSSILPPPNSNDIKNDTRNDEKERMLFSALDTAVRRPFDAQLIVGGGNSGSGSDAEELSPP